MTAIALLKKAVEYDMLGRKMEALKLYEDGIESLLNMCKAEPDEEKKAHYKSKILDYMQRAEEMKESLKQLTTKGEIKDKIHILDGATGYSYKRIFEKYCSPDVREVLVEEPYLKDFYQLCNLVMFCEFMVSQCKNLKYIKVITTRDTKPQSDQQTGFATFTENLKSHSITFCVEYAENMHDRQVILSNGYVIKIGRGLHYFKPSPGKFCLGAFDYSLRPCRDTRIDIFYCPENKK